MKIKKLKVSSFLDKITNGSDGDMHSIQLSLAKYKKNNINLHTRSFTKYINERISMTLKNTLIDIDQCYMIHNFNIFIKCTKRKLICYIFDNNTGLKYPVCYVAKAIEGKNSICGTHVCTETDGTTGGEFLITNANGIISRIYRYGDKDHLITYTEPNGYMYISDLVNIDEYKMFITFDYNQDEKSFYYSCSSKKEEIGIICGKKKTLTCKISELDSLLAFTVLTESEPINNDHIKRKMGTLSCIRKLVLGRWIDLSEKTKLFTKSQ